MNVWGLLRQYRVAAVSLVVLIGFFFALEYARGTEFERREFIENVVASVRMPSNELLPDIVPLPPFDLSVERAGESVNLRFATTYYNKGSGPLELRADPASAGVRDDIERDVFQRVFLKDGLPAASAAQAGTHRDSLVGNFLWHEEHLHYHFSDFIEYRLESVDSEKTFSRGSKATFCVRDVSLVEMELAHRAEEAAYRICGKELQGISVGWADTYFADYPDQAIDITDLPSGTYRLVFTANPDRRLQELDFRNNISWALFYLDMENGTAEFSQTHPASPPSVQHVHLEQPFGIGPPQPVKTESESEEGAAPLEAPPEGKGEPEENEEL